MELLHRIKSESCKSSQEFNSNSPVNVLDMLLWKICFNWQSNTGYTPTNTHPRQHFFVPWLRSPPIFLTDQRSPRVAAVCALASFEKRRKKKTQHGCGWAAQTELLRSAKLKPACQSWLVVKQEVVWNAMEISRKTTAFRELTWQTRQAFWMEGGPSGIHIQPLLVHISHCDCIPFKSGITVLLPLLLLSLSKEFQKNSHTALTEWGGGFHPSA